MKNYIETGTEMITKTEISPLAPVKYSATLATYDDREREKFMLFLQFVSRSAFVLEPDD